MKFNTQNQKKKKQKNKKTTKTTENYLRLLAFFLDFCFPAQWMIVKRQTYVQTQMPPQKGKKTTKKKKQKKTARTSYVLFFSLSPVKR